MSTAPIVAIWPSSTTAIPITCTTAICTMFTETTWTNTDWKSTKQTRTAALRTTAAERTHTIMSMGPAAGMKPCRTETMWTIWWRDTCTIHTEPIVTITARSRRPPSPDRLQG